MLTTVSCSNFIRKSVIFVWFFCWLILFRGNDKSTPRIIGTLPLVLRTIQRSQLILDLTMPLNCMYYAASNDATNLMKLVSGWEEQLLPTLRLYPSFLPEGLRKTTTSVMRPGLHADIWTRDRCVNQLTAIFVYFIRTRYYVIMTRSLSGDDGSTRGFPFLKGNKAGRATRIVAWRYASNNVKSNN